MQSLIPVIKVTRFCSLEKVTAVTVLSCGRVILLSIMSHLLDFESILDIAPRHNFTYVCKVWELLVFVDKLLHQLVQFGIPGTCKLQNKWNCTCAFWKCK